MSLQNDYDLLFSDYEKTKEGHALLTERTCNVIKEIYDTVKPEKVLEIGFNAGHTAFAWLTMFPELHYHSIDICQHAHTQPHANMIKEVFGERFMFGNLDSKKAKPNMIKDYDLVFIDGDHSLEGLNNDYHLCHDAGTNWILIDDYTLRTHIYDLLNHIHNSKDHKYERVGVYEYDDHDATSQMVLFRRID